MTYAEQLALPSKFFKIFAISKNRGSFGHNRIILVAEDGETWAVHRIQGGAHEVWIEGEMVEFKHNGLDYIWAFSGVECPERLPNCPEVALRLIFPLPS